MAVYTHLSRDQIDTFLRDYALGGLIDFRGIHEGIENSNYALETEQGRFVLTLFEHHDADALSYFTALSRHLAETGFPCPAPVADRHGHYYHRLAGRPAWIVQHINGESVSQPKASHCRAAGEALARLHLGCEGFILRRQNHYDRLWQQQTLHAIATHLIEADRQLIDDEMGYQAQIDVSKLPHGTLHSDLFRDNVLFEDDQLSGVLDLNDACHGLLLYDLAVAVNDWCFVTGALDQTGYEAMIEGYESVRPLSPSERHSWPAILRLAALRFWLSRLRHQRRLETHEGKTPSCAKPPQPLREILLFWRQGKNLGIN